MPIDLTLTTGYGGYEPPTVPRYGGYRAPPMDYRPTMPMMGGYGGMGIPGGMGYGGMGMPDLMKMGLGGAAGGAGGEILGMLANRLFGRDIGRMYGRGVESAMGQYKQYMGEAQRALEEHERIGREDIGEALRRAQVYGAPYREAGEEALGTYRGALGLGGSPAQQAAQAAFQASPAYQFMLQQGLQATRRGMAPTGLRGSGAEQRALMRYGTGLAAQEYGTWQDRLSKLAGLGAEVGERAAGREFETGGLLGTLGARYGGSLADVQRDIAQATAEAELARAQYAAQQEAARQRGISGILGSLGKAAGMALPLFI